MMEVFELPDLIRLEEFDGDIENYLEEVYQIFKNEFVERKPIFRGTRLRLKRYPLINGKEYTFYHFTHTGYNEEERQPDLRRMERIGWPASMINQSEDSYLKVWRNIRRGRGGTKNRRPIFHEFESYLVVLEDRGSYILPWTAYLVFSHKKRKLLKEYEVYINTEAAGNNS